MNTELQIIVTDVNKVDNKVNQVDNKVNHSDNKVNQADNKVNHVDNKVEAHVLCVMKDMEEILNGGQITILNILSLCVNAMQSVEKIPKLSSNQKKQIVLDVISKLIQQTGSDNSVLVLIPHFIDTAISLDKGELQISITPEKVIGCCAGIFNFLNKPKPIKNKNEKIKFVLKE